MLKRKILAAVLPVVAAGTVVGSGFSAWYFGDFTNNAKEGGVGISIEGATDKAGDFEIYYNSSDFGTISGATLLTSETFELNLDQGTGNDRLSNPDKGISFKVNKNGEISDLQNFTIRYKINETDKDKLTSAGLKLQYTFEVTLNEVLAKYVVPQGESSIDYTWCSISLSKDDNYYKYYSNKISGGVIPAKDISLEQDEAGFYYFDISFNVATNASEKNSFLKYSKKPESLELYKTMRTELAGAGLIEDTESSESAGAGLTKGISFNFKVTTSEN